MFNALTIFCLWCIIGWVIRETLIKGHYPITKTPLWLDWICIILVGPLVWLDAYLDD